MSPELFLKRTSDVPDICRRPAARPGILEDQRQLTGITFWDDRFRAASAADRLSRSDPNPKFESRSSPLQSCRSRWTPLLRRPQHGGRLRPLRGLGERTSAQPNRQPVISYRSDSDQPASSNAGAVQVVLSDRHVVRGPIPRRCAETHSHGDIHSSPSTFIRVLQCRRCE